MHVSQAAGSHSLRNMIVHVMARADRANRFHQNGMLKVAAKGGKKKNVTTNINVNYFLRTTK